MMKLELHHLDKYREYSMVETVKLHPQHPHYHCHIGNFSIRNPTYEFPHPCPGVVSSAMIV
jgi:hypothetical protein